MASRSEARLLIDAVSLGTLNLNPKDDGMNDEDLVYPDGAAIKRYLAVAKPLDPKLGSGALHKLPAMSTLEEACAVVLLFAVVGSIVYVPVLCILAVTMLSWTRLTALCCGLAVAMVAADAVLPDGAWPPCRFPASVRLLLYKYFGFKLIFPEYKHFMNADGAVAPPHFAHHALPGCARAAPSP
jgi:hypothetical protein